MLSDSPPEGPLGVNKHGITLGVTHIKTGHCQTRTKPYRQPSKALSSSAQIADGRHALSSKRAATMHSSPPKKCQHVW